MPVNLDKAKVFLSQHWEPNLAWHAPSVCLWSGCFDRPSILPPPGLIN